MIAQKDHIVFVGQFPPPVNGLTFINAQLAEWLLNCAGYTIEVKSVTGQSHRRGISFHASRVKKSLSALLCLFKSSTAKKRICYLAADGGLGLIYTAMFATVARVLRYRLFIHHHSFSYIYRRRRLMRLTLLCSGAGAVHVCLSRGMANDLSCTYGRTLRSVFLSNAAFVDAVAPRKAVTLQQKITIGLLSNLTADKGLYAFIEVLRTAKSRGLAVYGILAGPASHKADAEFIASLRNELSASFEYRGAIYDQEKARFFADIDVFVFPTMYLNEAQPTVIFEALAYGVPVISYDRGCIRSQVGEAGFVIAQDADAIRNIVAVLEGYLKAPMELAYHSDLARRVYERERCAADIQKRALINCEPVEVVPAFTAGQDCR
jgi:glycosyltransferase involved in cell wall biosynthesis